MIRYYHEILKKSSVHRLMCGGDGRRCWISGSGNRCGCRDGNHVRDWKWDYNVDEARKPAWCDERGGWHTHPPTIELDGNYAVAILEATVRSLSNLDLFRSNACWRQSSKLVQLWCSGSLCCKLSPVKRRPNLGLNKSSTHWTTELSPAMWALPNYAQSCGIALVSGVDLELTTFLSRHDDSGGGTCVCF